MKLELAEIVIIFPQEWKMTYGAGMSAEWLIFQHNNGDAVVSVLWQGGNVLQALFSTTNTAISVMFDECGHCTGSDTYSILPSILDNHWKLVLPAVLAGMGFSTNLVG